MIELKNITKKYYVNKNEIIALNDVSITLPDKGLITITGRSGCGKTTFLNVIANLDTYTSGEITTNYGKKLIASMIFQDAQLIEDLTVYDNLKLIANLYETPLNTINDVLEKIDILELKNNLPNQLSGGQKQRVSIARALLTDNPVLLCDEPTGNLDLNNAKAICEILKSISINKLVLVVTHDLDIFDNLSDRKIEFENGIIINDQTINDQIINENIQIEQILPNTSKELKLKNKDLFKLSFKGLKKMIPRWTILFITLFLTLLIFVTSINIMLINDSKVKLDHFYKNGVSTINMVKKAPSELSTQYDSLLESDYGKINVDYIKTSQNGKENLGYFQNNIKEMETFGDLVYFTNQCPFEVIHGKKTVAEHEVIVPKCYADKFMKKYNIKSYNELFEMKFTYIADIKIVGIYEDKNLSEDYFPIIMDEKTTYFDNSNNIERLLYYFYIYNNSSKEINQKSFCSIKYSKEIEIIHGTDNLNYNEVVISKNYAKVLIGDSKNIDEAISNLVGTYLTDFKFILPTQAVRKDRDHATLDMMLDVSETLKYKIVGISKNTEQIVMNHEQYEEIYDKFAYSSGIYGFAINKKISVNQFDKLLKLGFIDKTEYSELLRKSEKAINSISTISNIVGAILFLIMIGIIYNYLSYSKMHKKREIGILTSFGLKKKEFIKYLILDISCGVLIATVLANIMQSAVIFGINKYFIKHDYIYAKYLYYSVGTLFISLILPIIVITIYALLSQRLIKNKSIIDLVYER